MMDDSCDEQHQQPLKRSASVGAPGQNHLVYLNPSSPSGSDLSDSSLPNQSPVYIALTRPGSFIPAPIETESADPPTSLCLSLPGSNESNHVTGSNEPNHVIQSPKTKPTQEKQMFNEEFLGVIQEMVRKEVKSYMSGIELNNGSCIQTEATIMNAFVKRMGISRID
jgi:myb proto-oncogene protein